MIYLICVIVSIFVIIVISVIMKVLSNYKHLKRELDMKQRIKLKGRLKAYLQTSIILGIVLAGVNIGIYFSDVHSGIVISIFLLVYFTAMLILLYRNKPIIMNEFVSFATQYGQIQRRLLRDLELPHVLMDDVGKIIWTNSAFEDRKSVV